MRNKGEPLCDPVELIEANGNYAVTRHRDGQESTVWTSDLAPYPRPHEAIQTQRPVEAPQIPRFRKHPTPTYLMTDSGATPRDGESEVPIDGSSAPTCVSPVPMLQCSTRQQLPLDRYGDWTV